MPSTTTSAPPMMSGRAKGVDWSLGVVTDTCVGAGASPSAASRMDQSPSVGSVHR
ncbi:hypothetical protein [Arthrobacter sp. L77]|uniref:hypothetical protein n=1 Tax=Arthrobacter sp. L77 TaxID=1496689 RepID=UPI0012E01470|nr:hypothetical protein [Arthrobacter sp. L77]